MPRVLSFVKWPLPVHDLLLGLVHIEVLNTNVLDGMSIVPHNNGGRYQGLKDFNVAKSNVFNFHATRDRTVRFDGPGQGAMGVQ